MAVRGGEVQALIMAVVCTTELLLTTTSPTSCVFHKCNCNIYSVVCRPLSAPSLLSIRLR